MFIEHASIITSDALHVVIGVGLGCWSAVVLRRRLTDWLPWLVVLAAALFNETVDLWVEQWPDAAMQYRRIGQGHPADDASAKLADGSSAGAASAVRSANCQPIISRS